MCDIGVYIKGMTLKQLAMNNCYDCPIEYFCKYGRSIGDYSMNGGRPTSCPLVEVEEPHGRLVDYETIDVDYWEDADGYHISVEAETVIEAEGE